eukprot:scaffold570_cov401-Pavlova_lutheri.AAC.1
MQQHRIVLDTYRNFATGHFKGKVIGEHGVKHQHPASNILHNIEEIKSQLKECKQEGLRPLFVQVQLVSQATSKYVENSHSDSKDKVYSVHDCAGCSLADRDRALQQVEELKKQHHFLFKEWEQDDLPPVRSDFDHRIELQPGLTIPHRNYYPIPAKMQNEARQLLAKFLNALLGDFGALLVHVSLSRALWEARINVDLRPWSSRKVSITSSEGPTSVTASEASQGPYETLAYGTRPPGPHMDEGQWCPLSNNGCTVPELEKVAPDQNGFPVRDIGDLDRNRPTEGDRPHLYLCFWKVGLGCWTVSMRLPAHVRPGANATDGQM